MRTAATLALLLALLAPSARADELPAAPSAPLALAAPAAADVAERVVPVDLSLVPQLSLNGEGPVLNHLSLGLAVARSTTLRGAALAPVHMAERDVAGVQLTWAAGTAGGRVRGAQLTTIANVAGDLDGAQLAQVVNVARRAARGVQLGGALNWAGSLRGVQAGVVNVARDAAGLQASVVNVGGGVAGLQLAVVNVGGEVAGTQLGLVNVARRVDGLQLGLVNLAREADASVGLLSLVQGGRHEVDLFATELSAANVAIRLGGARAYGLLVAGLEPGEVPGERATRWTVGGGAGVGFAPAPSLGLDLELLAQAVRYDDADPDGLLGSLRATASWRATPWLAIFAGPTANVFASSAPRPDVHLGWKLEAGRRDARVWPGFAAGVRL